ncbi:replication-associated recombination protein A [Actinomyces naeslundii]|uniref:MgsA AAA+ ATPase, C-terminal domain protein n=2 Tax=Actinomyces naeslundii TaxID=1655 RepID=J3JK30_ACTNH|nr:replication-associated recombination protein A [Actinomyces naeslundii]EJN85004.1 MgsA AAA+ ATPase, C-terminal domain protein [Actinomyces naeslundii str. Howell 279]OMG38524.1 AAA family ATPase [Actinomyces naeslundii]QQC20117.1 replication-associated recombination protein A [Actinomyces naeslundii]
MDLFESAGTDEVGIPVDSHAPLAVRMRPRTLDELQGQAHLLTPGSPLRRLVEPAEVTLHSQPGTRASATSRHPGAALSSVILWGPPGTGKTTLAYLVARGSGRRFVELSAVTAGVKDVRAVVTDARRRLAAGEETVLFIDEVHRFSRSQQDALLPSVENRWVTLIAATTENPSFSVVSPLLSRSLLLTLHPLGAEDIGCLVDRAVSDNRGLAGAVCVTEEAREQIVRMAGSDARKALTVLEAAAGTVLAREEPLIEVADVEQAADVAAVRYDRAGDQHYDVISAFIKSMRGSDPDATMHYLARMIAAGEDPRYIARRIVIHAAEDVGLADPTVLSTAVAAQQAVALIGMPESGLILAEAALAVATAPKSNAVTVALSESLADVSAGKAPPVPAHLRDAHYAGAEGLGHGKGYRYPHDFPHAVVGQQYLPDELEGSRYYRPSGNGFEKQLASRLEAVRRILEER